MCGTMTVIMSRIRIELPESFAFATELPVRITDINYGGHMGNDAVLSLLHEARVRFLQHHGFGGEADIDGTGMLMVDVSIVYKREMFHGDTLRVEVGVTELGRAGCDIVYRVTRVGDAVVTAEAKTGMAFFDYRARKLQRTPERFAAVFGGKK
jgi:acyl-CoA thioesterase FadM